MLTILQKIVIMVTLFIKIGKGSWVGQKASWGRRDRKVY